MLFSSRKVDMGDCQNYGPFLGPYYNTGPNTGPHLGHPKRDHNFDNAPYRLQSTGSPGSSCRAQVSFGLLPPKASGLMESHNGFRL